MKVTFFRHFIVNLLSKRGFCGIIVCNKEDFSSEVVAMKLIVSCFISLILIFNVGLAYGSALPNPNSFLENVNPHLINRFDAGLGPGFKAILLMLYKVGYGVALVVTAILAIKLILTSPSKKAEVKASILPYLIGLLLLVAGVPIAIKVMEIYTILF